MVYCNLWLESKNAVFNTIRRRIFHQNMHNHQKSQIESRREELATSTLLKLLTLVHLLCVLLDDRHYRKTHELFSALSKLGKNLAYFIFI